MIKIIIALLFAYLLGSINPAYLIGKAKGFDIRTKGTYNAGASNAKIVLGWKYFWIVAVFDISKSLLAAIVLKYILKADYQWQIVGGCLAVLGHIFPFYLGFKGGKGFASYIGLSLFISFKVFIVVIIISLILAILTNYIVTATVLISLSVPSTSFLLNKPLLASIVLLITTAVIILKHKANFERLLRKEEIGINGKMIGFNILKKA